MRGQELLDILPISVIQDQVARIDGLVVSPLIVFIHLMFC